MQIEAGDIGLPVENIDKGARPEDQRTGIPGIKRVVVGEEARLRGVLHVDRRAGFGPQDVADNLDIAGEGSDADRIRCRIAGIDRVVADADIRRRAGDENPASPLR